MTGLSSSTVGLVNILVQNKWYAIAWSDDYKGNMVSPDYGESNHNYKPNYTTSTWAISITDAYCLKFTKLCLDSTGVGG